MSLKLKRWPCYNALAFFGWRLWLNQSSSNSLIALSFSTSKKNIAGCLSPAWGWLYIYIYTGRWIVCLFRLTHTSYGTCTTKSVDRAVVSEGNLQVPAVFKRNTKALPLSLWATKNWNFVLSVNRDQWQKVCRSTQGGTRLLPTEARTNGLPGSTVFLGAHKASTWRCVNLPVPSWYIEYCTPYTSNPRMFYYWSVR